MKSPQNKEGILDGEILEFIIIAIQGHDLTVLVDFTYICICMYLYINIYIYTCIWMFPKIVVPLDLPFLKGFFNVNHPFWGIYHYFLETPIYFCAIQKINVYINSYSKPKTNRINVCKPTPKKTYPP